MDSSGWFSNADRASISVEYAVAVAVFLAISGVLISGFADAAVQSEETVTKVELDTTSQKVATAIEDTDAIIKQSEAVNGEFARNDQWKPYVEKEVDNPEEVGGSAYVIRIDGESNTVTAETRRLDRDQVSQTANFNMSAGTDVPSKTVSGGNVVIEYNSTTSAIEING